MRFRSVAAWLALGLALNAHADVSQSAPDSFFLTWSAPLKASPAKAYAALAAVPAWWSDDNTFSGSAVNLSLKPEAGACFCERWDGGSAEHGRVVMALKDHLLRLEIALGPLQEYALTGSLSFWIRADADNAATLNVEYRVNGSSVSGLDVLAPQVDALLGNEIDRLQLFIDTGSPTAPDAEKISVVAPGATENNAPTARPGKPLAAVDASTAEKKAAAREDILSQWAAEARAEAAANSGRAAPTKAARKSDKPAKSTKKNPAAEPQQ